MESVLYKQSPEFDLLSSLSLEQICTWVKWKPGLFRWLNGKESTCQAGDLGLIPGLGKSSGEGDGYLLQYSSLGNSMERGAWWVTVHVVAKSWTWLSDWTRTTNRVDAQKNVGIQSCPLSLHSWSASQLLGCSAVLFPFPILNPACLTMPRKACCKALIQNMKHDSS